ncbi:MAG: AmmeMemoRadiSam system protein A [Caldisericaceae bacterium]|nr:AmmeMemoRadiSam system protein A [Caldisericaceae bacterium]
MIPDQFRLLLLKIARSSILYYLENHREPVISKEEYPYSLLWEKRGTFVTLTENGNLRGCIGSILPVNPLIVDVSQNAINAAFRDPRFYPLTKEEFPLMNIEISVLTVPQKIEYENAADLLKKIRPYKDGIIIRHGPFQATFLPQVWEELPDKESFLSHLCLKAGLSGDCYLSGKIEVYRYEVEAFSEKDFK